MLLRLAWWGLNIYGVKKTFDLAKENLSLKQKSKDDQATIRTLARNFDHESVPPLPTGEAHIEEIVS
jgi:hypothetical protein